jgi:hypothetical protein
MYHCLIRLLYTMGMMGCDSSMQSNIGYGNISYMLNNLPKVQSIFPFM